MMSNWLTFCGYQTRFLGSKCTKNAFALGGGGFTPRLRWGAYRLPQTRSCI